MATLICQTDFFLCDGERLARRERGSSVLFGAGRYPVERVPHPWREGGPDWFVMVDSYVGAAAGYLTGPGSGFSIEE